MWKRLQPAIVAVLLGWSCWSGPGAAQTDDPGPVRLGDRWSYEVKDAATGDIRHVVTVIVVDITEKEITTRVNHRGKDRPQTIVFDANWGMIDNSVVQYRPSRIGIQAPLRVGKEWRSEGNSSNIRTGDAFRISSVAKVTGQEKVTTAAGTFDTYRIEVDTRQTNTKDQTKVSRVAQVFWYAPPVNRWVKATFELRFEGRVRDSIVEELTEYSRKP